MAYFAIILDYHRKVWPHEWAIVTRDESLEAARERAQFRGILDQLAKAKVEVERIEETALVGDSDQQSYPGAIYRITELDAPPDG